MKRRIVPILVCAITLMICIQPVSAAKVNVTKVAWDSFYTHKTLKKGEKFQLVPKVMPEGASQKVTYKSDKPEIAKVTKKGKVTAKKKGEAVITVTAKKTKISSKYYIHVGTKSKKIQWTNTEKTRVIYVGEPFTFKAECTTKKAAYKKIIYKSSKSSVLKISKKGVATPKKNGKATITAWAADQSGKKVKCKVTVKTKVTKVKLSAKYKTCFVGQKLQIASTITPDTATDKTIKWKSANKTIATVSKTGVVQGKSAGKVKITATAQDGSKKKGTYTVYVRNGLDPSKEKFIAHRGLSSKYPENTVQSFTAASQQSFAAIETDIWENSSYYQPEQGDETTWIKGSGEAFAAEFEIPEKSKSLKSSGKSGQSGQSGQSGLAQFTGLSMDGEQVDADDYETAETDGTLRVSLKASYLETLDEDEHVITAMFEQGDPSEIDFTFTVKDDESMLMNPALIIMHDSDTSRLCDKNIKVKKLTELNIGDYPITKGKGNQSANGVLYKIPLLSDYLDVIRSSSKTAVIEIKDDALSEEAADKLIEAVDDQRLGSRTYLAGFDKPSMLTIKKKLGSRTDIKLTRFLGARDKGNFEEEIEWCKNNGMDQVSISKDYIKEAYVKKIHEYGMQAAAWTVDDKNLAADLLLMGCDYVTTNSVMW